MILLYPMKWWTGNNNKISRIWTIASCATWIPSSMKNSLKYWNRVMKESSKTDPERLLWIAARSTSILEWPYTTRPRACVKLQPIKEILETSERIDPKSTGTKSSAYSTNLFVVGGEYTKLETKKSEEFHKVVAKLLFTTKRDRLNTGTVILYLTTWVR